MSFNIVIGFQFMIKLNISIIRINKVLNLDLIIEWFSIECCVLCDKKQKILL